MTSCEFCLAASTGTTTTFENIYGSLPSQVIGNLELPNFPSDFFVMRDVAPVVLTGLHLMVLPKTHSISLAACADQHALLEARDRAIGLLWPFASKIIIFEHGAGCINKSPIACGGCHIDHAHAHFIGVTADFNFDVLREKLENNLVESGWVNVANFRHITQGPLHNIAAFTDMLPYIHLGYASRHNGYQTGITYKQTRPEHHVESQLLRRLISEMIYGENNPFFWNWRDITELGKRQPWSPIHQYYFSLLGYQNS